ncbi:MAG: 50S ribosomal protein L32 [bacterium]|nr:50S ribosomal protein L32 [bacterium]MDD5530133.1 50S ribosomal protein L32 [bacterium]
MGAPRRRVTKTRGRDRRTNWKSKPTQLIACPKCGTLVLPHRRCQKCGNYKDKEVLI